MQETTLTVSGMTCKGCVARVDRALRQLDGVEEVSVELGSGTVHIRHAPALTTSSLTENVSAAGYPCHVEALPQPRQ